MPIPIPPDLPPELQQALRDISDALDKILGSLNIDLHGRRIINAGDAVAAQDYVTKAQVAAMIAAAITGGTSGSSTSSSTSGGGGDAAPSSVDVLSAVSFRG